MPASVLSRETRSPYWKYRTKNTRQNTSRLTIPNGKFSFRILRADSSSPRRREPPGKKGGTTFAFGAVLHVSRSPCGRCPARESSARLAPTRPAPGPALPEASSDASKSKMQHWPVAINLVEFRKIYGQVAWVCDNLGARGPRVCEQATCGFRTNDWPVD